MQRAGDIMYVPSMWAHMVVNTRPSIGAALEFDTGYWLYWVGEATLVPGGRKLSDAIARVGGDVGPRVG